MQTLVTYRTTRPAAGSALIERIQQLIRAARPARARAETGSRRLSLPRGSTGRVPLSGEVHLTCDKGTVWITLDAGGEDIILEAGEARCFRRGGGLLIEALQTAYLTVTSS